MSKSKKILDLVFTVEGLYAVLTNPWVATVVIPSIFAGIAVLMAWARDLPWLLIYVLFFVVAACASIVVRQVLDRWQTTTDNRKLIYKGVRLGIARDEETGSEKFALADVYFVNAAIKPLNVELDSLDLRIANRVQSDEPRRTSRFLLGNGVEGRFSTWQVDLSGLSADKIPITLRGVIRYGYSTKPKHRLEVNMVGEGVLVDGKYEFHLWSPDS